MMLPECRREVHGPCTAAAERPGIRMRHWMAWISLLSPLNLGAAPEPRGISAAPPFTVPGKDAVGQPVERLRAELTLSARHYLPYPGDSPLTRRQFPQGFPRAMGSGICLKGAADGQIEFWVLGDRGPNGDGPELDGRASKIFPAPAFNPQFGVVRLSGSRATLTSLIDVLGAGGRRMSGMPRPEASSGPTQEIALADSLMRLPADPDGIDPEAIACEGRQIWLSDEYGPAVLKVDPERGRIQERLEPGHGLPLIFAKRRLNRGIEALAFDRDTGRLWGALQSVIDDGALDLDGRTIRLRDAAPFIRWVEVDPNSGTLRQFAYPVEGNQYRHGKSGEAKLSDMTALGGGRFVVIEEGNGAAGSVLQRLYLVEVNGATDIDRWTGADLERSAILGRPVNGADWRGVTALRKRLLVDLNQLGWNQPKAEGLALVDERTLALTNDNDYGVVSSLLDAAGRPVPGEVERCRTSGKGPPLFGDQCPKRAVSVGELRLPAPLLRQEIWLLRFARPLRTY